MGSGLRRRAWPPVRAWSIVGWLWWALAGAAGAAIPIANATYQLPATVDPTVASEMATELWAEVWQPTSGGPYPLVLFLHGNHATCGRYDPALGIRIDDDVTYTYTGTCPEGYVVAPSHLGYAYLAADLAARGFVVVSINANRGVNAAPGVAGDEGLNLRRGRLVLRHMQYLAELNAGTRSPPVGSTVAVAGMLDFAHVGLMGHSRGGEGMRAAVQQYRDAGSPWPARIGAATFEALFEIAPVDGQTSRVLDAQELAWNVLIGGCDGDVYDWQGVRVFDRMLDRAAEVRLRPKSTFLVYGANHNFFNSEWQQSDATRCLNQSRFYSRKAGTAQRTTAHATLLDFMQAHVGPAALPGRALDFDPSYPLDTALPRTTTYARGYTATPRAEANLVIDNFDRPTGQSTSGAANDSNGLAAYAHVPAGQSAHEAPQRAALLGWEAAAPGRYLQVNAAASGSGRDASAYGALEFRIMLQCPSPSCVATASKGGDVDLSIALADANGGLSAPVALKSVAVVRWPGGSYAPIEMLQTVRIALSAFPGIDLTKLRGVRFIFDRTSGRSIYLANVRLTQAVAGPGGSAPGSDAKTGAVVDPPAANEVNRVVAIRRLEPGAAGAASLVEVEVTSTRPFPIGGALPELQIGTARSRLARPVPGAGSRLAFVFRADAFDAAPRGADVRLRIGGAAAWVFAPLAP